MNIELCKELSNCFGPSGFEHLVTELISKNLPEFTVQKDSMQNVYVVLHAENKDTAPWVMLDAHTDEVGFMVQSVTASGLLKVVPLGGWVEHNIPAHKFIIKNTKQQFISAISASKPPHFMSDAERKAPLSMDSILLDVGATSKEEVENKFFIEPGLPVAPDVTCEYNKGTDMFLGKAFDCRLGCFALIETLKQLKDEKLAVNVVGVFSSQEEVGLRGARVAAQTVHPRLAICLEGTPADDNFTPTSETQGAVKAGVQLRFRDGTMVANPAFMQYTRTVATDNKIKHQCAVRTGGGTNAGNIHLTCTGTPTMVLGVPVRYAHTHYGYSAGEDVASMICLAVKTVKTLTAEDVNTLSPIIKL